MWRPGRRRRFFVLLLVAAFGVSCAGGDDPAATAPLADATESSDPGAESAPVVTPVDEPALTSTTSTTSTTVPVVETINLNHVQMIGSHNSFHLLPPKPLFDGIAALSTQLAADLEYEHLPLPEQLETFGIRQFELDVFADPIGGLYANRASNAVVGLDPISGITELDVPGFKVMHTQDFDYETTCLSLVACLTEIEIWSSAHPTHLPIMIMLEFKELSVPEAAAEEGLELTIDLPWAIPVRITPELLDALDAEIRSVFPAERIIEPDDVRGDAATLENAVLDVGWPSIDDSRGKVLFSMTDGSSIRDMYVADHPSLEGRPIFTNGTPGQPDAAFVRFDDPTKAGLDAAATAGYLIRTRTDSPTANARTNDSTTRDAALATGAHYLSTDYYAPTEFFPSDYTVELPGGVVGRCNPVTAPPSCTDDQLAE
jgi:Phosphoinositide phospholipase C, Ca2+-dependent